MPLVDGPNGMGRCRSQVAQHQGSRQREQRGRSGTWVRQRFFMRPPRLRTVWKTPQGFRVHKDQARLGRVHKACRREQMKTYTEIKYQMLPNGGLELVSEKSFEYEGQVAQCLRAEQGAADAAEASARDTGAKLGTSAAGELGQLNPFMSREMHAEHLFDPNQMNEMLTHAGLGAGAEAGTLTTAMQRQNAVTGNAAGGTKALQELGRDRMKADAGVSEGVAAQDVMGAKNLQQQGAQ